MDKLSKIVNELLDKTWGPIEQDEREEALSDDSYFLANHLITLVNDYDAFKNQVKKDTVEMMNALTLALNKITALKEEIKQLKK